MQRKMNKENKQFNVYVIECVEPGYFYVGITQNLARRLESHLSGKGSSIFVKEHKRMDRLISSETVNSKQEARELESKITKNLITKYGAEHVAGADLIWLSDRIKYAKCK